MTLSDEQFVDVHKMIVSIYMEGKLKGDDMSKHEESFKNSIEFLKQRGLKVGPHDLDEIMDKSLEVVWSRHDDTASGDPRRGGYKHCFSGDVGYSL